MRGKKNEKMRGKKDIKMMFKKASMLLFFVVLALWMIPGCSTAPPQPEETGETAIGADDHENRILGEMGDTGVVRAGEALIEGVGTFTFRPEEVQTLRPDIFQDGHISLFDVLVHLHEKGHFQMDYYFDEEMNTYVLNTFNEEEGWWYNAYYDGGWPEKSVFRMDHYPYKDKMFLSFVPVSQDYLDSIYKTYRDEINRKRGNEGKLIVPEVIIEGRKETLNFENVEVRPHGLRNDVLQPEMITAIDVILTLGEAGEISYDLQWYESIGTAEVVKSYWVNRINEDESYDRCGFVYEAGAETFRFFRGNHNHIPSDVRVINSPEYVKYFWICI